jgi:tetratricopeptide (TPR) repeat protein
MLRRMRALAIVVVLGSFSSTGFAQSVPGRAMAAFNEGKRLFKDHQVDEAIEKLEEAVKLAPSFGEAWTELGNAHLEKQAYQEAAGAYDRGLKAKPDQTVARYNLAFSLRKLGKHFEAAHHYRLYLQQQPNDADAHYGLAESLRAAGDKLAAAEAYEAYARAEKNPSQQKWIAKAKETAAQLRAEAKSEQKPAVAAAPPPPPPPTTPAKQDNLHLSFSSKPPETKQKPAVKEETKVITKAEVTEPAKVKGVRPESFRAGLTDLQNGDYAAALPRLETADRERPNDPLILAALAGAHLGLEHGSQAEAMYQRALSSAADDAQPGLYLGLGEAQRLLGKTALALESYRRALEHARATTSIKRFTEERIAALE